MPFLELPDGGVPWNGRPVHLQPRVPRRVLVAHLDHILVLLALNQEGSTKKVFPWSLATSFPFLFFFRLGMGSRFTIEEGGEEQEEVGTLRCLSTLAP